MTLQMLEYYLVLAERRSFTEAANACFISQPALSRAIASLEKELGCAIVRRGKTVELTPAGEVLLVEARRVLEQVDSLVERVQAAGRIRQTMLVGYPAYGILNAFRQANTEVLASLREEGAHVETVYDATPALKQRLLSGELDAVILPDNCVWNLPRCRFCRVCRLRYKLMVPRKHPLFESDSVSMGQLAGEKFVFFSPDDVPMVFAKHVSLCREAGFSPEIVGYGRKAGDVIDLLHQHGAVGIASSAFDYTESDELRMIPIRGVEPAYLALAIRERCTNQAVLQLFRQLQTADADEHSMS